MGTLARKLRTALAHPNLAFRAANIRYHSRFGRRDANPAGDDFFDEEWDNLILLDGCRFDTFAEYNTLPGRLERRQSKGSTTVEFLKANVDGRDLLDTVYVTANGQLYHHRDEIDADFHAVENIWTDDEGWSEDHHTVLPETTTRYAKDAAERYPNKRLVVHYIQPHYPFIDTAVDVDDAFDPDTPDFWLRVMRGEEPYDRQELYDAYEANLQRTLPHVEELVTALDGTTVVTADHGNMIGERSFPFPVREWGHPQRTYVPGLVEVPWLVIEGETRKEIVRERSPDVDAEVDEEAVEEHLRHLGYAE